MMANMAVSSENPLSQESPVDAGSLEQNPPNYD